MKRLKPENYISLAIGSLALCLDKIVAGYGYGGYDLGLLYGAQNLLVSGQDIQRLPFVLPLLFAWLIKASSGAFGNTFYAPFIAASLVYSGVLLGGNYLYCRARSRGRALKPLALIVFTSATTINLLNPGHLWHSDLTSLIAISIIWCAYCIGSAWDFADRLLISALAALVLLCKQNLSPLYFLGYLIFTIKSCHSEKSRPWLKSAGWVIFPILASAGLAFIIANDLGISLYDYYSTLRSIAAERGSPLADPENYLKFVPPEILSIGSIISSLKNLLFYNNIKPFGLVFSRSLWLIGFYLACIMLPLSAICRTHEKISSLRPKIPFIRAKSPTVSPLAFALLSVAFLGLVANLAYPLLARLGLSSFSPLLVISIYLIVLLLSMAIAYGSAHVTTAMTSSAGDFASVSSLAIISMSFFFVSYIGLGSNWDLKSSDLSVSLISLYVFWDVYQFDKSPKEDKVGSRYFAIAAVLSLALSSISAITRLRMSLVGPPAGVNNFECRLAASDFWGDNFWSTINHCELDNQARNIIRSLPNTESQKVFFGPRMETYYSAMSKQSPLDMPIWWHPGTSFSAADQDLYVNRFKKANFQLLIFMKDDFTRMPSAIIEYVQSDAYVKLECSRIDVYLSRQLASTLKAPSGNLLNCQY